ncbi:MAG TPA: hypothetical protein VFA63_10285 [Pseudonocardiaceae bacterium]|nr:hypothetical protein [Pseudonocardiaceae bacterium]
MTIRPKQDNHHDHLHPVLPATAATLNQDLAVSTPPDITPRTSRSDVENDAGGCAQAPRT